MQYDNYGLVGTTLSTMIVGIVVLCEVWVCVHSFEVMWKYVFFLCMLGNHIDYDYVLLCVVLGLMHGSFYLAIWVYNSYVDDDMVVCRITYKW